MDKEEKLKPLKIGAIDFKSVEENLEAPTVKGIYDWKAIRKAIDNKQAYALPMKAKKNSVLTGIRREGIPAKLRKHVSTGQLVIVPA